MEFIFSLLCLASALLLLFLFTLKSLAWKKASNLPLPPGSMGWPYVGETFQLYSQNPNVFFASKQNRYST